MLAYRTLRSDWAEVLPCRPDNRKVNGSEFPAVGSADELAVVPTGAGGVAPASRAPLATALAISSI